MLSDYTIPIAIGEPTEIADGILWLRLPLPSKLDHINVYLLEDNDGWVLFDTGLGDQRSRDIWNHILGGPFRGRRITRMILSHFHADHMGLAGWFKQHFDLQTFMARKEHAMSAALLTADQDQTDVSWNTYYRDAGFDMAEAVKLTTRRWAYREETTGIPGDLHHLADGDMISIGGRSWRIITGVGHSLEQIMLLCEDERILLAADHLLPVISPNIGFYVNHREPDDPLGGYLSSLSRLHTEVPTDTLVLPGHKLPFRDAQNRIEELQSHHAERCNLILNACQPAAKTCKELHKVLFARPLEFNQLIFAIGETLAHITFLCRTNRLIVERDASKGYFYRTAQTSHLTK